MVGFKVEVVNKIPAKVIGIVNGDIIIAICGINMKTGGSFRCA